MDLSMLVVPAGVEMVAGKSAVKFVRGSKRAYLKGSMLEITNPNKKLGDRVKLYSAEVIEKCHLGTVKAAIPAIEDVVDLNKILNRYYSK